MAESLPKSLHTVRILVAVAGYVRRTSGNPLSERGAVLEAARVIGYSFASLSDPLIVKAVAQLGAK